MTFGRPSGPPASSQQTQELLKLFNDLGHANFREARGPMQLTQSQAGGRFTRDEATALIQRLQDVENKGGSAEAEPPSAMRSAADHVLRRMPSEQLAAELRRRNWMVIEP